MTRSTRRVGTLAAALGCLLAISARSKEPPAAGAELADQPYVFELISTDARFENDGTAHIVHEARARIQTDAGVPQLGQIVFPYVASRSRIDVDYVRVHNNGATELAEGDEIRHAPAPVTRFFPVFSDLQLLHLTPPALRRGSILEYRLIERVETPPAPGRYFFEHRFARGTPVLEEVLRFDLPTEPAAQIVQATELDPEIETAGDRVVYRWSRRQLEPEAPTPRDDWGVLPRPDVELSSFESWEAVGEWYRDLQRDRARPDDVLRARAQELVRGLEGDDARIKAIYDFVRREFRYSALLFGMSDYQPHHAREVLDNGYGDCKGKHTLLQALLDAVGYQAAPVLIGALREETPELPSPQQFDHLITRVDLDDRTLWMDSTGQTSPLGYLTPNLRGKLGLLVPRDRPPRLVTTPDEPPFAESQRIEIAGEVDDAGHFAGRVTHDLRGDQEFLLRTMLLTLPRAQWSTVADAARKAAGLPKGEIDDLSVSELTDTDRALRIEYSFDIADYLDRTDATTGLDPVLPGLRLEPVPDDAPDDFELDLPSHWSTRLTVRLPADVEATAPVQVALDRSLGSYVSRYAVDESTLVAEREFRLGSAELAPERRRDYEAFRKALAADERQEFRIHQAPADSSAAMATATIAELTALGRTAAADKDWPRSIDIHTRIVESDPEHATAWYELGRALTRGGEPEEGVDALRRQIEIEPFHDRAHKTLGWALEKAGRDAEAEAAYRQQLELFPLDHYAAEALGELLAEDDRCAEAIPVLERAASLDEEDEWSRLRLARCRLAGDDPEPSLEALVALGADSDSAALVGQAASAAYTHRSYPRATRLFDRYLELAPGSEEYAVERAVSLVRSGREDEGFAVLERRVDEHPTEVTARRWLSHLLSETGRREEAVEAFRALLEIDAENPEAHARLARLLQALNRDDEALEVLDRWTRLDDPETQAWSVRAALLAQRSRYAEAAEAIGQHLRLHPRDLPALELSAWLAAQAGELEGAIVRYRRVLELTPDSADAHHALGALLYGQERSEEARAPLARAVELDPDLGPAHLLLGRLTAALGEYAAARDHFERARELLGSDFPDQDMLEYVTRRATEPEAGSPERPGNR